MTPGAGRGPGPGPGPGSGSGPRRRHRALRGLGLGLALALPVVLLCTEVVWFFPLTPLHLDTAGRTRLPPPGPGRARLLFVGDILLGDAGQGVLERRGYDHPFGTTRQLIGAADLAVGNQEGPIAAHAPRNRRKQWAYRARPEAARALRRAGFDLVTLANNHTRDCGDAGIRETLTHLRAAGVTPFGAGLGPEEAHRPAVVEVRGVRVALFGYLAPEQRMGARRSSLAGHAARPGRAGSALATLPAVRRDLDRLRAAGGADVLIAVLHLGDRYQREPAPFERDHARALVDAGFHAVVGHGTHTLAPVELYRGRPILYGVGNFAFGSGNVFARFSLMAFLELDLAAKRLVGLQLLPLYTVNWNPWVWFQTRVLLGWPARQVLGDLARRSLGRGAALRLAAGPTRLVATLPVVQR